MEPSPDAPEPHVPFSRSTATGQHEEQTVGLVFNQETGQLERVYRQSATSRSTNVSQEALNQEMPEMPDAPDDDYLRRWGSSLVWMLKEVMSWGIKLSCLFDMERFHSSRKHTKFPQKSKKIIEIELH